MASKTAMNNFLATCPTCAKPLPSGATAGHCPTCLWKTTLGAEEEDAAWEEPWNVLGDYELYEEIGRGGMGVIYRARQKRLRRIVAVKVLRGAEFAGEEARARFRLEAEAVAQLQHPGIVAIHDVGEADGVLWFSMDFVEGANLDERVREHPLAASDAASLAAGIAAAVQHAHEHGVLHRDLKPSNILLADGQPRITDFGLARRETTDDAPSLTRTGQTLGSPGYAAPEQALRGEADVRTDVYGLGALLYHLLTGRPPFHGPTLDSILLQLRDGEPISPRRLIPTVPRDLETICLHALQKNPLQRYASAGEMAADLGRFLEGKAIRARPSSAAGNAWRWCRRHPVTAALLIFILLGTGAAFWAIESARSREQYAKERTANANAELAATNRRTEAANAALAEANARLNDSLAMIGLRLAEEQFAAGDSSAVLGTLARVLRKDPSHFIATQRLASALWNGDLAMPRLMPFFACTRVEYLQMLADGKTLLVGTGSGPTLYDAAAGKKRLTFSREEQLPMHSYLMSPDGRTLAGWGHGEGKKLNVWDVQTGQLRFPAIPGDPWFRQVIFSVDGARILAPGRMGSDQWLDSFSGSPAGRQMLHPFDSFATAGSRDGKLLATSQHHDVYLWDAHTQELIKKFAPLNKPVKFLHFSSDSQWIFVCGFEPVMRCFRLDNGEPAGFEMHHDAQITKVAFSNDAARVISGADDNSARVWSLPGGEPITPPLRHSDILKYVAFSPDERVVVTCSGDNSARLWDAQTGRPLSQPLRHGEAPMAAAFSPDGETLYTSGADRIVQRWDIRPRGKTAQLLQHAGRIGMATWSPDGRFVASNGADKKTVLRDAYTLQPVGQRTHSTNPGNQMFSPNGRVLASASRGGVRILKVDEEIGGMDFIGNREVETLCFDFSPDGQRLIIGQRDGQAMIFDTTTLNPVAPPLKHSGRLTVVRFSPDGKTVLTCEYPPDDTPPAGARLWNSMTGEQIGEPMLFEDDVNDAVFSPDGAFIATGGNDDQVGIWDARTSKRVLGPMLHNRAVRAVTFSPDGRLIATASSDGTARLWDARTSAPVGRPMQHGSHVVTVAFSPDGRRVATGSKDKTARIWDAATGAPLSEPLHHEGEVRRVSFHPTSERLLTVSEENAAHIWDVPVFPGPAPDWLMAVAEILALESVPDEDQAVYAAIAKYSSATAEALTQQKETAWGRLGQRLFAPKPAVQTGR